MDGRTLSATALGTDSSNLSPPFHRIETPSTADVYKRPDVIANQVVPTKRESLILQPSALIKERSPVQPKKPREKKTEGRRWIPKEEVPTIQNEIVLPRLKTRGSEASISTSELDSLIHEQLRAAMTGKLRKLPSEERGRLSTSRTGSPGASSSNVLSLPPISPYGGSSPSHSGGVSPSRSPSRRQTISPSPRGHKTPSPSPGNKTNASPSPGAGSGNGEESPKLAHMSPGDALYRKHELFPKELTKITGIDPLSWPRRLQDLFFGVLQDKEQMEELEMTDKIVYVPRRKIEQLAHQRAKAQEQEKPKPKPKKKEAANRKGLLERLGEGHRGPVRRPMEERLADAEIRRSKAFKIMKRKMMWNIVLTFSTFFRKMQMVHTTIEDFRELCIRKKQSAERIQRTYRASLRVKYRARLMKSFMRAAFTAVFAAKMLNKRTATAKIKEFLKVLATQSEFQLAMVRFRTSSVRIQRWWRDKRQSFLDKEFLLTLQWNAYEEKLIYDLQKQKSLAAFASPAAAEKVAEAVEKRRPLRRRSSVIVDQVEMQRIYALRFLDECETFDELKKKLRKANLGHLWSAFKPPIMKIPPSIKRQKIASLLRSVQFEHKRRLLKYFKDRENGLRTMKPPAPTLLPLEAWVHAIREALEEVIAVYAPGSSL